jgi:serine/threonine-protein kinase
MILVSAVALSIICYRLWDIDLTINRTLVYGGLTLLLGAVLIAAFFVLKAVWEAILGSGQEVLAAVLPAVFIALIFNPTRKRVQSFVDRRIYHLNFDLNQLEAAQKLPEVKNPGALTGRTLGGYQVLGVLGKGGMGEVYQAHANGQSVALKILPEDLAKQSEFVSRFEREAATMRALNHPRIVKLLVAGEQDGVRYLALEFVDGKDLSDHIKQHGKLDYDDARSILSDLASALDYAHAQGFVHRDIKPSNVMVRGDDPPQALLMDFGIAKIKDAATRYTGSGAIGTIDYMAPEQILTAKEVDKHADIYALGVLAYEMLTGEKPFKGSAAQVMFAHLQQPPPDAGDVASDVPKSAVQAIERAMAKDAAQRYDSAGEFAAAL